MRQGEAQLGLLPPHGLLFAMGEYGAAGVPIAHLHDCTMTSRSFGTARTAH